MNRFSLNRPVIWRVLSLFAAAAAWELAGRKPISLAFPTFLETAAALVRLIADGTLLRAYAVTLEPFVIGMAVCGLLGVGCGVAMGLWRSFEWFTLPLFIILQTAPMAAVVPLITFIYGIGLAAKVLAVVMFAAPVIVLNSYQAVRNTNPSLVEMCRSFLGTRWQEIVKIIVPHASAVIFAGLRLGTAAGFIGVILAELLITPTGIGDVITYHRSVAEYAEMYAAIASIIIFATVTVNLLQLVERRLFRVRSTAG